MAEGNDRKKIKRDEEMVELVGYVHNVSPVKISEKNNSYFTCSLQTERETNDVVCLCPDKHKYFQRAEREDSPMVIKNVRSQIENRRKKLFFNYMGSISVSEGVNFEKRIELKEEEDVIDITLKDICTKPVDVCAFYSLSGKVINVSKAVEVIIYGNRKNCQNAVITDGVHKVNMSLYGNLIDKVEKGKSYRFTNVAFRKLNNTIKITVRKPTVIVETDFELIGDIYNVGKNDSDCENISIDVSGVKSELRVKCPCCGNDYKYGSVKHVATVRCTKCDMLTKTAKLATVMTTRVDGTEENGLNHKLTIPNFVMKEFTDQINKEHLLTDPKGLEEFIIKQSGRMHVMLDNSNVKETEFDAVVD